MMVGHILARKKTKLVIHEKYRINSSFKLTPFNDEVGSLSSTKFRNYGFNLQFETLWSHANYEYKDHRESNVNQKLSNIPSPVAQGHSEKKLTQASPRTIIAAFVPSIKDEREWVTAFEECLIRIRDREEVFYDRGRRVTKIGENQTTLFSPKNEEEIMSVSLFSPISIKDFYAEASPKQSSKSKKKISC